MLRTMLVLAVLFFTPLRVLAGVPELPQFRRYGFEHGLPRSTNHIGVDRQGYVWVATSDGLARFDGIDFKLWRREVGAIDTLPDNVVETIFVDARNRVWAATPGALSVIDADRKHVRALRLSEALAGCGRNVTAMTDAANGGMWIATSNGDLCQRNGEGQVQRHAALARRGIPIYALLVDGRGRLLLGTGDGLMHFERGAFHRIAGDTFSETLISMLTIEPDGALWIGSEKGLHRLLASDKAVPAPWRLPASATHASVLRDRHGDRWIGTMQGLYRDNGKSFALVRNPNAQAPLDQESGILYMQQDLEGGLWLVTYSQGVMYLPPDWDRFAMVDSAGGRQLEGLDLRDVAADGAGGFWVATATNLYRLDRASRVLRNVATNSTLGVQWIHTLRARRDGTLWIGHASGLVLFDPATNQATNRLTRASSHLEGAVDGIVETGNGTIWISSSTHRSLRAFDATGRLLPGSVFDWDGKVDAAVVRLDAAGIPWRSSRGNLLRWNGRHFRSYRLVPGADVDTFAFAGNLVWVSRFGALEVYEWNGHALVLRDRIDSDEGLPAVAASGMLISSRGQVWLNTLRGLALYSPAQRRLRLFGAQDGLVDPDVSLAEPVLGENGTALAMSTTGLVLFDAEMRMPGMSMPRLVIENLSAMRNEDAVHFDTVRPVLLQPYDRDLRVNARLLSFADPHSHRYRFKLDGYDPDWVAQHANGERVFSRLDAGRYRLHVQAAGSDGAWSNRWTTSIVVSPPWWRTPQSLVAFVLLAALLLFWLAQQYRERLKRRHALQLAMHTRDVAEQASHAKTRFLATLGHEVRTPMTGVLGMSELLLGTQLDTRQRGHVESIRRAGDHLLRLVNDALDLARIEAGKLDLDIEPFELRALVDEIAVLMAPIAERKGLQFTDAIDSSVPRCLRGDCGRVRQILLNLVGNAIKFTERGEVSLRVTALQPHAIRFEIADTGPGLNDEQCARLFQRFEQADGARTAARHGGSGLGLAISQELAAAMGGSIRVDSAIGKGTCFCVELPLLEADEEDCTTRAPIFKHERADNELQILLVEDDPTVADVIAGLLGQRGHHVTHAAHGLAALVEVARTRFDVGLLDLDLPGMDGLALARHLRAQGFTAPLLAVTARSDADAESQSDAAGFDGFLRKPVTGATLMAAVEALVCLEAFPIHATLRPVGASNDHRPGARA
ncbi:MAG: ATP-binding protein [Pseudomonadota bacterium]|nr:ATP-binding protein [Pseudomonadota bacterium]